MPAAEPGPLRRRQLIHLILLDTAVLAELAVAVYAADAWRARWDFTVIFCAVFFGLLAPTVVVSRILARRG